MKRETLTDAELAWDGDRLVRLVVPGAVVHGDVVDDPLFGTAHVIEGATTMSVIDWARPTEIPAIAAPGKLAPGAGGILMNTLALLAERAGVAELFYAGPYPTPALYRTLVRSFRTPATEAEFTANIVERAARVARDRLPFPFIPAPHRRVALPGGHAELRDGLERAVLAGTRFERDGSPARLVPRDGGIHAELWFGDAPWADVATLSPDGVLLAGPHPLPACTSDVVGKEFPPPLRAAIAELVAEVVPAPLADAARQRLIAEAVRWADLGARAAAPTADGFAVHAVLWERVGPHGLGRLALALAEALAPVVTMTIVAELSSPHVQHSA
ncbi:MAG: hypothetical protein SFX73_34540 [Kofleriaceae bacterium]|nr:hypothetical protein [Kofleriaceae bacterium]